MAAPSVENLVRTIAAEIDRVVIRAHELAGEYPNKPKAFTELKAFPQLLVFAGIVLLERPISRDEVKRIVPYTPGSIMDGLVDNNVAESVVTERDGELMLTDTGRAAAEATVELQESAVGEAWSDARGAVDTVVSLAGTIVERTRKIEPPRTPSNFAFFAPYCDRPTREGTALRLVTAMRYWRADAHLGAIGSAGLEPFEAHALNRLWDAHRGLERIGQGFPEPGRKGVASLEERGLATGAMITNEGIKLREQIEEETDRLTAPMYDELDASSREDLLGALRALPGDASPGIPGA